jgi:hypothetical protein
LLREDFDRLCGLSSWLAGERVVSLEWRIVLRDLSCHVVPISFRHPHSLHLERGCHATALLQALYAFEATLLKRPKKVASPRVRLERKQKKSGKDAAPAAPATYEPIQTQMPLIGWDLIVKERLTVARRSIGLFGDQATVLEGAALPLRASPDEMSLLQLENKLPIQLAGFKLREDWLPEDSFTDDGVMRQQDSGDEIQAVYQSSLRAVARERPLYLYERPATFAPKGRSSLWQFTESTMSKWWQTGRGAAASPSPAAPKEGSAATANATAAAELRRDYYRLTDSDGRALWVYTSGRGQCFIHGIFA